MSTSFWLAITMYSFWIFNEKLSDEFFVYTFMCLSSVCSGLSLTLFFRFYNMIIKFDPDDFGKLYYHIDFYLEEFVRIGLDSIY